MSGAEPFFVLRIIELVSFSLFRALLLLAVSVASVTWVLVVSSSFHSMKKLARTQRVVSSQSSRKISCPGRGNVPHERRLFSLVSALTTRILAGYPPQR